MAPFRPALWASVACAYGLSSSGSLERSWSDKSYAASVAAFPGVVASPPRRRKKSPQAVVDSDLLRFISEQKSTLSESDEPWLGQFNRNRIATLLKAKGLPDEDLALAAGESVQQQACGRIARRRLRDFLRQRGRDAGEEPTTTTLYYSVEESIDLMMHYGLNANDVAHVMQHSPGVLLMRPRQAGDGATLEQTIQRVLPELLMSTLGLRKYDARKVIRKTPGLLTKRGSQSAQEVVAILMRLGVSTNSIARDKNALTTLLCRSPSDIFRLVSFLAGDAVRMPVDSIGPLLRRAETRQLLDAVTPARPAACTDDSVLSALWGKEGRARKNVVDAVYRNMTQTAWTLRHEIGTADLAKVIASYPTVLLLNVEEQILPVADFLMEVGMWQDDLVRVLQLYPTLLGSPVEDVQRNVDFLLSVEIPEDSLPSILRSFPNLLKLEIDHMREVVEFIQSIGISNVGRFVTRLPPVLGYSIDTELRPKWEFLQTIVTDPRFAVSRFPAYFSYPLERVIKQRYEYLRDVKNIPTQLVQLDQVVRFGDQDFSRLVARDDDPQAFAAFCQARSKERHSSKRSHR